MSPLSWSILLRWTVASRSLTSLTLMDGFEGLAGWSRRELDKT